MCAHANWRRAQEEGAGGGQHLRAREQATEACCIHSCSRGLLHERFLTYSSSVAHLVQHRGCPTHSSLPDAQASVKCDLPIWLTRHTNTGVPQRGEKGRTRRRGMCQKSLFIWQKRPANTLACLREAKEVGHVVEPVLA